MAGGGAGEGWLAAAVPGGLPLAFGCRRLWWLGYRRAAWLAGAALGAGTVAASLAAGPVALVLCAVVFSVPAWIGWYWLVRRG